ncbi:hypothetical protein SLS62_010334 [Diatrype stigma]|uniref:Uncharacterized protein n=1 Tax=Diatrype stigma TaxID=117547 RepID=A0AAN9YIC0_9PEZI
MNESEDKIHQDCLQVLFRDLTLKHPEMPQEVKEVKAGDVLQFDPRYLAKRQERAETRRKIDSMHPAAVQREYPYGPGIPLMGDWPRMR